MSASPGTHSGLDGNDGMEGGASQDHWLLCVVVCSGSGLYVGPDKSCGDIFCMLHTFDSVTRSKTAVTGMVYNNHVPTWPSNGNGNAFVLPVKSSPRDTNLVITVWDGSESMEEANPVGKVEINLAAYISTGSASDDSLPPRTDFPVDLVPRLAEFSQGDVKLTLMLERARKSFVGSGARDRALGDLLGRLSSSRKRDRIERVHKWGTSYPVGSKGPGAVGDYSLVALLTKEVSPPNVEDCMAHMDEASEGTRGGGAGGRGGDKVAEGEGGERPLNGMLEKLSEAKVSASRAPMRAQAELLARLKPIHFEDGGVIMAAGTKPESIFFVRSGAVTVTVQGEEVSRIEKGQCLGEVGLLLGERRIADVKACGRTELFELMEQDLWMALDMFPGLYHELHIVAEMRYQHVHSRENWGSDNANVYAKDGPLREFQQFLKDVSSKIAWNSHKLKKKAGLDISTALSTVREPSVASPHVQALSPPSSRAADSFSHILGSISETDDFLQGETGAPSAKLIAADSDACADQLSRRLEQFEHAGVFGGRTAGGQEEEEELATGAIMIPQGRNSGAHTHAAARGVAISPEVMRGSGGGSGGSLSFRPARGDLSAPLGSIEQAMRKGNWLMTTGASGSGSGSLERARVNGWTTNAMAEDTSDDSSINSENGESAHQAGTSPAGMTAAAGVSGSYSHNIMTSHGSLSSLSALATAGADLPPFLRSASYQGGLHQHTGSRKSTRSTLFKIRFRKVHDCYTAEELGCSPRRSLSLTVRGVSVQCTKESDINSYFCIEEAKEVCVSKSEIVRSDKSDLHWPRAINVDLEEDQLVDGQKLRFSFFQSRKLWSDRSVGYSMVDVSDTLQRPGVNIQHTYPLVKDRKSSGEAGGDDADESQRHATAANSAQLSTTLSAASQSSTAAAPKGGDPKKKTLARSNSLEGFFRWGVGKEDDDSSKRQRGTVTLTLSAAEPVRLPFSLQVPPISQVSKISKIVDHLGKVVCVLEYIGRSRCAWCTNVDPSEGFQFDFFESNNESTKGASKEPCCNACSIKGWSECVVLWDGEMKTRLGNVWTDVTPRRHARSRLSDHDNAHFASVRAAASTRPEISMGVRFKVVPTFQEIVVRTTGSMITGKSCQISHQVLERVSDKGGGGGQGAQNNMAGEREAKGGQKGLNMIADITRVSNGEHSSVILHPGKDAARALLLVVGINEATRLRPKSAHDGSAMRDKFDRDYEELSTEWQAVEEAMHDSASEGESEASPYTATMMGMAGYSGAMSPSGSVGSDHSRRLSASSNGQSRQAS